MPYASVIIPTYRRPKLLLECVASVLRDEFTDFEVLVVDQDPAGALERELHERFPGEARLRYLFSEPASASRARNAGIEQAAGQLLLFIDDDLEAVPGWVSAYVETFRSVTPPPGMVTGRIDPIWLVGRPTWFPHQREYLLGLYAKGDAPGPMPAGDLSMVGNSAVLRRVVDAAGRFDERIGFSAARANGMLGGEDSLLSLKVMQANGALYYQPRARALHKISAAKLTKRHLLQRSYWDGATTVVVAHLAGTVRAPGAAALWWPARVAAGQLAAALLRRRGDWSRAGLMDIAAACACSLGTAWYGVKLAFAPIPDVPRQVKTR